MGEKLEEEVWDSALQRINDSSLCARLNLIQFKVVHRAHLSKSRLAMIYSLPDASIVNLVRYFTSPSIFHPAKGSFFYRWQ